jgi:hypothetical protein
MNSDMCKCECGWEGKLKECETFVEKEDFGIPEHIIHICPACKLDKIIEYWSSDSNPKIKKIFDVDRLYCIVTAIDKTARACGSHNRADEKLEYERLNNKAWIEFKDYCNNILS